MDPTGIAAALREIATYLDLEGDRYRARAYARAADSLQAGPDVPRLLAEGRLTELDGVGESIARVIGELAATGATGVLDRLRARWPAMIVELARLPGVGAPRARVLHQELAPADLDELAAMCDLGRVRALRGFGKVSEARIRDAIRGRHLRGNAMRLHLARDLAGSLAAHLRGAPAAREVVIAGAVRRWLEVVDAIALAVSTTDPDAVRERLRGHPMVTSLEEARPGLAVGRLATGLRCELHTAPPERFGAALVIATGSEAHLAALRARGVDLDAIAAADEAALYRAAGLPAIPPEVRDGTDELSGDDFADLISAADLTGAVHCHTVYSDGRNTIEEMAAAAAARGLAFLTITDHSASASYAGGLTADRLRAQGEELAAVQRRAGVRLLHGTESDILRDGALDYPLELLGELDLVIASVHQRHKLDQDAMTARLVTAMRQPVFKIWGHALGRLVLGRPPIDVRFEEILDAICDSPAAIEINGDPHRLDLDPDRARQAQRRGVKFVLSTDAHSVRQLDYADNAVAMARRARIRKADVLNALPPDEFARQVKPRSP